MIELFVSYVETYVGVCLYLIKLGDEIILLDISKRLRTSLEALDADRITCLFMNHSRTWGMGCVHVNPATNVLLTVPRRCFCCGLFWLSVFFGILFVFDFLFVLFRISWWPSAGKDLSSLLSACVAFLYAVLIVYVPFPFGVWGRVWNSIVSVPDH